MDSDFGNTTTFAARPLECLYETPIPAFLSKTYDLVDDASLDSIISWGEEGCSFVVWDPIEFSRIILPRNFKHNNFSSFVRQLNTYIILQGFRKIDTDKFEFTNEGFVKGKKHLLRNIQRRRSHQQIGSSRESGRTAIQGEVECLRQDRNFVMQELTQLQQQQRGATEHMEAMKQKLETAEKRQKQMVSFLAEMLKKSGTEHKSVARKCLKQDEGSSPKGQLQLEPELYGVTLPSLAYHNEDMEEQQKGTVMDSVIRGKDAMSPEIEYEHKSITSSRLAGKCSSKGQLEPELCDITYPSLAYHIEDMEELQQGTMMDSVVREKDVMSPINQAREECLIMDFDGSSWADANMVDLDPAVTWDIDCGFDKWPEEDFKFFN